MENRFQTRDPNILVFDGGWTARHVCLQCAFTEVHLLDGRWKSPM
jgi:hypothetical protein